MNSTSSFPPPYERTFEKSPAVVSYTPTIVRIPYFGITGFNIAVNVVTTPPSS